MSTWTTVDWRRTDPEAWELARSLVSELEETEGERAPLSPSEFLDEVQPETSCSHWYSGNDLLGFGLLRPDGVFRAVLRPDQREMSLFLPMLAWADEVRATRFPDSTLKVVAQDDDVCLPFLLLRLDFSTAGEPWTRSDDPDASVFRYYGGGRVED